MMIRRNKDADQKEDSMMVMSCDGDFFGTIGEPIFAETPEEIGVSIAAEIIKEIRR